MEPEVAISARALSKRFGKVVALAGLDLDVPRGGIVGLLGPAGAGKTTALRLLAGRLRPTGGSATVAGVRAAFGSVELRRRIGVVDEQPAFHEWMTGQELTAFAADLAGVDRADLAGRVSTALAQVGLDRASHERIAGYSIPMRRRLAIAQAIVAEPEVLLLDEPLGWLDPASRGDVLGILRELAGKVTVLLATDRQADADAACDRVVALENGRVAGSVP